MVVYGEKESKKVAPKKVVAKKSMGKMSEKQKGDLKKHMEKMGEGGMDKTQMKSHRMKLMVRVRKGMTIQQAHDDVSK